MAERHAERGGRGGTGSRRVRSTSMRTRDSRQHRNGDKREVGARGAAPARSASRQTSKARVPVAVAGAAVFGLAVGTVGGARLASGRRLKGTRLLKRRPLRERATRLARGAMGSGIEAGRVVQRMSGIESELHELRVNAAEARRKSPIEVVLESLTRRPGVR